MRWIAIFALALAANAGEISILTQKTGAVRPESVALTEPYQIAAKLIDELAKGGVALGDVNNLRA